LGAIKEEIRRAKWVGESEGRIAPLNEAGYQQVAALRHSPDMMAFARRILDVYKKKCTDEGAMIGLVSYYDGKKGAQDFATLQKELLSAPWAESRDVVHGTQETLADKMTSEELALLQQSARTNSRTDDERDVVAEGIGNNVPINDKGYKLVADLKDDHEMQAFIQRVLDDEFLVVGNHDGLVAMVSNYSGSKRTQSLKALRNELRHANWVGVGTGRTASLDEAGYQEVAKLKSRSDMIAFATRILDDHYKRPINEGSLVGLVAYYDGEKLIQDYAALQKELISAPWVENKTDEETLPEKLGKMEGNYEVKALNELLPLARDSCYAVCPAEIR